MRVSLVVAVADNGVIGRGGALPWHLPDDLKHFKAVTLGKAVLMGRLTFESIGRALPGRRNLVMSRTMAPARSAARDTRPVRAPAPASARPLSESTGEVEYVDSVEQARALIAGGADDPPELCVIGGAQVYALALPFATRIYLTQVHATVPGDTYFPGDLRGFGESAGWRAVRLREHPTDERHAYAMSFVQLDR